MELRDYQRSLIDNIYSGWINGNRRIMAQLPTGAGKTIAIGHIVKQAVNDGARVAIIAHREELLTQAANKVSAIASTPVGIIKHGYKPDYERPIQVASVRSLVNRLEKLGNFDFLVIDEAHHSTASTYRKIISAYPDSYLLGVTATPIRLDGSGFRDSFDELVCGISVRELIELGHLTKPKIFATERPMRTEGVRKCGGDWSARGLARANDAIELAGDLVATYRELADGKRCLVFALSVAHSIAIAKKYNEAGIRAAHLDGSTPSDTRSRILDGFAQGKILVIANCQLFDEGLDIPAIEAVQIAKPTASLSRWLQMAGRALRPAPGKEVALILDHTENYANHGSPARTRYWSLDGIEKTPKREPMVATSRRERSGREPKRIVERGDRPLMEVIDSPFTELEWMEKLDQLFATQKERGYKPGWIYYQLVKMRPPLGIWKAFAIRKGYSPDWAKIVYSAQKSGNLLSHVS